MLSLPVIVAVFAETVGVVGAVEKQLFRHELAVSGSVLDPDPVCDCSCYGETVASTRYNCVCPPSKWQSCKNGFGNPPQTGGPVPKELEADCCPYDWRFLQKQKAVRLMTAINTSTSEPRQVATINASLNFMLRWTMSVQMPSSGNAVNVFNFTNGDNSTGAPALKVLANKSLQLTFGDKTQPTRVVASTNILTVGKFYNFELLVQDCPQPSCVYLRDSEGQNWLTFTSPSVNRTALDNLKVYFGGDGAAANVNVRMQNIIYSELPYNAQVLTSFPLLPAVENKLLASVLGVLDFRMTFDVTLLTARPGSGNLFMFRNSSTAQNGTLAVDINPNRTLTVKIALTSGFIKVRTSTDLLALNQNYSFELNVIQNIAELVQLQPNPFFSADKITWLMFESPASTRLVVNNSMAYAFVNNGTANTCANAVLANLVQFKFW